MGIILRFKRLARRKPASRENTHANCEIVIFPGVRIERHNFDLAHRVRDVTGGGYDGFDGKRRPRKSS